MNKRTWLIASLSALAVLTGCATSTSQPATVADTVARTPELSVAAELLQQSGLAETLRGKGPYTVFVPNNDAFNALPAAKLAELRGDQAKLQAVLGYHVIPAQLATASVANGPQKTVQGADVTLYKAGSTLTIENAIVSQADIAASNGSVNVIDTVLFPPKKH